jgi:hypothetical protein
MRRIREYVGIISGKEKGKVYKSAHKILETRHPIGHFT